MNITNEQRDQAYNNASEIQKYLYASPESGELLWDIAQKHDLISDEQYKNYALAVGDVVLGFSRQVQLPTLLSEQCNLDDHTALSITNDLLDFLKPLTTSAVTTNQAPQSPSATPVTTPQQLAPPAQPTIPRPIVPQPPTAQPAATTQPTPQPPTPPTEQTFTSAQSDLLKPLSQTVTPPVPTAPQPVAPRPIIPPVPATATSVAPASSVAAPTAPIGYAAAIPNQTTPAAPATPNATIPTYQQPPAPPAPQVPQAQPGDREHRVDF